MGGVERSEQEAQKAPGGEGGESLGRSAVSFLTDTPTWARTHRPPGYYVSPLLETTGMNVQGAGKRRENLRICNQSTQPHKQQQKQAAKTDQQRNGTKANGGRSAQCSPISLPVSWDPGPLSGWQSSLGPEVTPLGTSFPSSSGRRKQVHKPGPARRSHLWFAVCDTAHSGEGYVDAHDSDLRTGHQAAICLTG